MLDRFEHAVWLYPAALALHVAEEAPGFTRWARRHASPTYTQRDFVSINAAGLAMTAAGTWAVSRWPSRPVVFAYFAGILTQQALWNALFHAGTALAWREYSPGLWTALAQVLLWRRLSNRARRERLITRNGELAAALIGCAIHAAAVRQQVFRRG